jgi:hypothetical protein
MSEPPKAKEAAPSKKAAPKITKKTTSNVAYLAILSNLEAKLALAEPVAFSVWELTGKTEDLANWLQAQNQLRITSGLLGRVSESEAL